jgi:Usg-like family
VERHEGLGFAIGQHSLSVTGDSGRPAKLHLATLRPALHFHELRKFLDFWSRGLDGLMHSVTVAHAGLIKPAEFKAISGEFRLN